MNELKELIRLLAFVAFDSRIKPINRLVFVARRPFDLLLSKNRPVKSAVFVNGKKLSWRGNHLNLLLDHLHSHLETYASYYGDGKVILDVGGSFGIFTSTASYLRPDAKIYAFEPAKESFKYFELNCSDNEQVQLIKKAVGESTDKLHFSFDESHPEGSRTDSHPNPGSYIVDQVTLDDFIVEQNIGHIDLLKIDIEGSELHALRGAQNTLKITANVIVETETIGSNITAVIELMTNAGFSIVDIGTVNRLNKIVTSVDLVFRSETGTGH